MRSRGTLFAAILVWSVIGCGEARLDAAQARIERIVSGPDGNATGTQPFDDPDA